MSEAYGSLTDGTKFKCVRCQDFKFLHVLKCKHCKSKLFLVMNDGGSITYCSKCKIKYSASPCDCLNQIRNRSI